MFTLRDLMSRNIEWAAPEDALNDVAKKMDVLNVSDLPVCEGGRIVGILTRTRIVSLRKSRGQKANPLKAREAMARDVTCGAESLELAFFAPDALPADTLPISRVRIADALARQVGAFVR